MARNTKTMLAYEAKKKPELQTIIDNIHNISELQIIESSYLKWIKSALLEIKRLRVSQQNTQSLTTQNAAFIVDGFMPDPIGYMRRWTGLDTFVRLDRGGSLQVCYNDLLWLPINGGIWMQNVFSRNIDAVVPQNSRLERLVTKSEYIKSYREQINKLLPDSHITVGDASRSSENVLSQYGVRIS